MRDFGRPVIEELRRLVVVSPHFDDAVLGCGQLLSAHPGATVVTVLGGRPASYPAEVTALGRERRLRDRRRRRRRSPRGGPQRARRARRAASVWLEFSDHQYVPADGARTARHDVAPALEAALVELDPTAVFFPFGLGNPDHVLTHGATPGRRRTPSGMGLVLLRGLAATSTSPGCWRGGCRRCSGTSSGPRRLSSPSTRAASASSARSRATRASCRRSSRTGASPISSTAPVPEQYWRLQPPPAGWEAIAGN